MVNLPETLIGFAERLIALSYARHQLSSTPEPHEESMTAASEPIAGASTATVDRPDAVEQRSFRFAW
jgi:hypothetical protein